MTVLAVIGSRTFSDMALLSEHMSKVCQAFGVSSIVSGGAKGADSLAVEHAQMLGLRVQIFKPDWAQFGRGAGPIRNRLIVDVADVVLAFWDGESKGTKHAVGYAQQKGKHTIVVRIAN